jgi:hypothetical protein
MPDVQESLDQLATAKLFTSLDLSSAFWQLPLDEQSRDCTAFITRTHGLLRWKVMPMGYKNVSACFQRTIEHVLGNLRFSCCVVYIDDVCIYSDGDLADHMQKVCAVMRALRVTGFSGNAEKCQFAQTEITFLGYKISNGNLYAMQDKVKCMLEYTRPNSITELKAFLGLTSYYRKFIRNYSHIAAPLTALTRMPRAGLSKRAARQVSAATWAGDIWQDIHQRAFEALKGALLSRPILALPQANRKWRLATDASKLAIR